MGFQIFTILLTSLTGFAVLDALALTQVGHTAASAQQSSETRVEFFHRGSGR